MDLANRIKIYKAGIITLYFAMIFIFHFMWLDWILSIPFSILLIVDIPLILSALTLWLLGMGLVGNRLDLRKKYKMDNYQTLMFLDFIIFILTLVLIQDALQNLDMLQNLSVFFISLSINTAILIFCSIKVSQIK